MIRLTVLLNSGLCLLLAFALSGCGSSPDGTVAVSGIVKLDGQPLADASVAFMSGGRMVDGQTDTSGRFTVDAATGANKVAVSKLESVAPSSEEPGDLLMPAAGQPKQKNIPLPKSLVPAKYASPETSGLSVEVKSDMAEVTLELSSK